MICWKTGEEVRSLKDYYDLGKKMEFIQNLNMGEATSEGERLGLDSYYLDRYLAISPADYEEESHLEEESDYWKSMWIQTVQIALLKESSVVLKDCDSSYV